jgi:hypothetical protein
MSDTKEQEAAYIAGLLRELAGRENDGDDESVAKIKAELKRVGYKASAPAKRAEKRPSSAPGEKRG